MGSNTRDIQAILREQVVPSGSNRYGVVIGIEEYRDERLNLRCAKADAEAMYELMIEPDCGMFEEDNVALLLNEAASKESVWNALAGLRRKAGKDDTVWVYYAGHAAPEGNDFYWVPFDGNVDDLYATGLSRRQIAQVLNDISAARVITFLDCCHAAATAVQKNPTRAVLTAEQMLSGYQGKGRVVISASDGEQKSVELPDEGYGVFTHYLIKGLRGAADLENTGVVHLDGLWKYLEGKVSDASQQAGNRQTPQLLGEHSHKLALSLNPLETHKKMQIADKIRELVGLDDDQLSTEEGRYCLSIIRNNPRSEAERDVAADFGSVLDGSIRAVTFKRLIHSAMNAKVSLPSRPQAVTPPSSPSLIVEKKAKEYGQEPSIASELDAICKRYSLGEKEALQRIDAWSVRHPEYLNPISEHAELIECKSGGGFVIQVQALVETRKVELNHEPFSGNRQDVQTERLKDKWDVPITVPGGFEEATETYTASVPQRLLTCKNCGGKGEQTCSQCNGSGGWICDECQGTSTVQCRDCDGTGKHKRFTGDYEEKVKCTYCHGNKVLPCTTCKGVSKKTCPACGGNRMVQCETCASSGQLAEVPRVLARFAPEVISKTIFEDNVFVDDLSGESGIAIFNSTTANKELPWCLDEFPLVVIKQIRNTWKSIVNDTLGKIHRIRLRIDYVPFATCKMRHDATSFDINILGGDHVVKPSALTPKDMKYLQKLESGIKYFYGKSRLCGLLTSRKRNDAFFDTIAKTLVRDCFSGEVAIIPQTSDDKEAIWDEAERYVADELRRRGVAIVPLTKDTPSIILHRYERCGSGWENIGVVITSSTGKTFEHEIR